ncbi:GNAT family N-acetyltransferase [Miniphocaeibacter massiliensis]|uniref:GNAT family N-acetyltransferase n=1 Tax=Miniphocaeibacter massiliensis TaxID=2041841 RepID=UPI000C0745AB|nr:GNAT family N-acetyltransferase [Miniphocaeibacter massiliensis]
MKYKVVLGKIEDLDKMEYFYNEVNEYLESNVNYPSWKKGVYPVKETAEEALNTSTLFIIKEDNKIIASVILDNIQEKVYKFAKWKIDVAEKEVLVVRTLVVHPLYKRRGLAEKLLEFSKEYAKEKFYKTIRLDVSINNLPAIDLYEKNGFEYIDTVDLGLNIENLKWFKLYEYIVQV